MLFLSLPILSEDTLVALDSTSARELFITKLSQLSEQIPITNQINYQYPEIDSTDIKVSYPTVLPLIRGIFNISEIQPDKLSVIADNTVSIDFTYSLDTGNLLNVEIRLNEMSIDNQLGTDRFLENIITLGVNSENHKVYIGKIVSDNNDSLTRLYPVRNVKVDVYEALFEESIKLNATSDIQNNQNLYFIGNDYKNGKSYLFDSVNDKLYIITNSSILEQSISDSNNKLIPVYINDTVWNQMLTFAYQTDNKQIVVSIYDATENLLNDTGESFIVNPVQNNDSNILEQWDIAKDYVDTLVLGFDTDTPDIVWIMFINYSRKEVVLIAAIYNQTENRFAFGYYISASLSDMLSRIIAIYPPYILLVDNDSYKLYRTLVAKNDMHILELYVLNFDNGKVLKVGERIVNSDIDRNLSEYLDSNANTRLIVSNTGAYLLPKPEKILELIL